MSFNDEQQLGMGTPPDIQEAVADDVSRLARTAAALYMVRDLPTEDIITINERFPRLAETALTEILNRVCPCGTRNSTHSFDGAVLCSACIRKQL
jgi:hypothetical protein